MPSFATLTTLATALFNKPMVPPAPSDPLVAPPQQFITIPFGEPSNDRSGISPLLGLSPPDPLTGEVSGEADQPPPFSPLSFNLTVADGVTHTYISERPPKGCDPEINGTYVALQNISFHPTTAACDDNPNATVGLFIFGSDAYLMRPGASSITDTLYQCTNIAGYEGLQPPRLAFIKVFENPVHCTAPPTAEPPAAAPNGVPQATTHSAWLDVLPKVLGISTGLGAVALCGCLVNRRMQARQVDPAEAHAPAGDIEMVAVASRPEAAALTALTD